MNKTFVISILLTFILAAQCIGTAYAGGAATGGASEWTQIMNNTQLMGALTEATAQTGIQIDTYVQAYQTAMIAKQNLNKLQPGNVQDALSSYQANIMAYSKAGKSISDLGKSATQANGIQISDMATMQKLGMTPSQFYDQQAIMAKNGVQFANDDMNTRQQVARDIEARGKAVNKIQNEILGIDGNIKGMQNLNILTAQSVHESININSQLNEKMFKDSIQAKVDGQSAIDIRNANEKRQNSIGNDQQNFMNYYKKH